MRGRLGFVALAAVVAFGCTYAGGVRAQGGVTPTEADLRQGITLTRGDVQQLRDRDCRARYPFRPTWLIPDDRLRSSLRTWQLRLRRERHADSACLNVRGIIRQVFGPTAGAALRVAECESHLWPQAVGAAGERGLFQIHPVHRSWLGATWTRLFNPRVNARVAYRMSRRGYDWSAWSCRP